MDNLVKALNENHDLNLEDFASKYKPIEGEHIRKI